MSSSTSTTSSYSVNSSSAGGVLRITGLNTGIDVDSVVKSMLTADQTRIDQAKQKQQLITWKQEAYQSIITDVKALQSAYFDVTNASDYLLTSNNYNNMATTSSDSTTVTAKAAAGTMTGTYKIGVSQIAEAATIGGTSSLNSQYKVNLSNWESSGAGKSITFNLNGSDQTITLSSSFSSVSDLVKDINNKISDNSSLSGKVSASMVSDGTDYYIKFVPLSSGDTVKMSSTITDLPNSATTLNSASTSTTLKSLNDSLTGNITLDLNYNGSDISVTLDNSSGNKTIADLISAINSKTGGKVIGKFDDTTGEFSLQTISTGSTSSLQIKSSSTTSNLLTALGGLGTSGYGKDAIVTITKPGSSTSTTLTESSNSFTVNGVTYSITGTTTEDKPISISVTKDTSKMHDLISKFLDKYNDLVDKIQTKLTEKKDYDYAPLTDSQKESMSDTQISQWEEKAKQGILRNDDNLQNLLTSLRQAFTSPVQDSSGNSVSTIYFGSTGDNALGIDTSDDYSQGSKITITDDQKFTEALTDHADEIMKLFTSTSTSTDSTANFNQSGIFQRISQILKDNVGIVGTTYNTAILTKYANVQDDYSVTGGSGTGTLPDQIYTQQLLITKLTDAYNNDQTKYYNQFSALETAMEQLSAQQNTISAYFS